jgi:NAD(P)-dependent dehydrogenase (short-subunit alcohol dehydrogenase family)
VLYNLCKAGVNSVTKTYAHGLGELGIRVNAVAPGSIATDLNAATYADPAVEKAMCDRLVLGRRGKVDDIANAALFLASKDSSYITGQILFVDGGWTLWQTPCK